MWEGEGVVTVGQHCMEGAEPEGRWKAGKKGVAGGVASHIRRHKKCTSNRNTINVLVKWQTKCVRNGRHTRLAVDICSIALRKCTQYPVRNTNSVTKWQRNTPIECESTVPAGRKCCNGV